MPSSPVRNPICLLLACLLTSSAWGQPIRTPNVQVQHFSVEEGLADRDAHDIVQDQQGYIWVATSKGLSRFDGYGFLTYDTRPRNSHQISLPDIYRLVADQTGRLLIYYNFPANDRFDLLDPLTGQLEAVKFDRDVHPAIPVPPFQAPDGAIYTLVCDHSRWSVYRFDVSKRRFGLLFDLPLPSNRSLMRVNFLQASDGTFWFAYNTFGGQSLPVLHSDSTGKLLRTFELSDVDANREGISDCSYAFLTETASGNIWVAAAYDGLYTLDPQRSATFERHAFLREGDLAFAKDAVGNLLVYQQNTKNPRQDCVLFTADGASQDYGWLFGYQTPVYEPFSENFTQGLFAGSRDGFYKYWLNPLVFRSFLDKDLGNASFGISTRGMAKTGEGNLLIGTENDGVFELDLGSGRLSRPGDRAPQLKLLDNHILIRGILSQGDSIFWITGRGELIKYMPSHNTTTYYNTGDQEIWGIAMGKDGKIWMADFGGRLLQMDPATGDTLEYKNKDRSRPLEGSQPTYLIAGQDGTLWAGSTLAGLIRIDPVQGESRRFTANPGDPSGFNSNQIACIYETEAGLLWVGTLEGGLHLFDPPSGRVTALYTRENGLCHNSVVGILPDGQGNYWLSTFNGLSFFNTEQKTFRNYSTDDALSYNEFNRHSAFYDREAGRFYFGGMNGVNTFAANDMRLTENAAPLLISRVSYAVDNDSTVVQSEGLVDGSTLTLPPGNGFLHLHLALADYRNPAGNQFAYKLEGLDKGWIYLGTNRDLRLDHLPAGTYTLQLRGADYRGTWSTREISLRLVIQTVWYKRWWAWMLYTTILAAGGFSFYRFQLRQKIAEKEAQRLHELDAFKSRFFTNITHEFRTPLTVILGSTGQLLADDGRSTPDDRQGKLRLIKRNGESLLRLINQLLDLARLESNSLKMNYVQGDVLPYLRYISESLHSLANAQNVLVRVESDQSQIAMDYDPERLLQIVHNLLSNAVKFTPSGGQVTLRCTVDKHSPDHKPTFVLSVSDTGAGIPADDLPFIFDRFYQAGNHEKAPPSPLGKAGVGLGGTGIGLALTKELVQQMGGKISVESAVGQGSVFTVRLPITHNGVLEAVQSERLETENGFKREAVGATAAHRAPTPCSLLIIEDNPDVVEYLKACLAGAYSLDFAYNGRAGIEKALETIPDLIVSDVMMPEKDGFEVCDFLKNDERTSHVPIILLTAKADTESRIAGLRRGADAYLAKPFHQEELLLTVANALESRKKMQARFAHAAAGMPPDPAASPGYDVEDAFVQKVRAAVEGRLSDASFSVDDLCRALAMSQPQLHRKLTALTGKNATQFIRVIRLDRAKALLLQGEKNVGEVAFEVGFEDPKYFSRVFTEAFGVAPSKL
jgi:signal transduction histidine kinase/DNA-binding response OmpR family regulator/streptogramin lyase